MNTQIQCTKCTNIAEPDCHVACLAYYPHWWSPSFQVWVWVGFWGGEEHVNRLGGTYRSLHPRNEYHILFTFSATGSKHHRILSTHCVLKLWVIVHAAHNWSLRHIADQVFSVVPSTSFLPRSPSRPKKDMCSPRSDPCGPLSTGMERWNALVGLPLFTIFLAQMNSVMILGHIGPFDGWQILSLQVSSFHLV